MAEKHETIAGRCPICGAPSMHAARPFCSRRCADVDLARWLKGAYVIQTGSPDADEDGDADELSGAASDQETESPVHKD